MSGRDLRFDPRAVSALLKELEGTAGELTSTFAVMEVCGTHTHTIASAGLRALLPPSIRLVSGPGCPVCVTPVDFLDRAEALTEQRGAILCTFGDLFRVPSSRGSLELCRAKGCDIRVVYSPKDALDLAEENPAKEVIFLGVGFETTAPLTAAVLVEAENRKIENFSVLSGHKTMPNPLRALASDPELKVNAFILPGHVSVITGTRIYDFLAGELSLSSAVAGFSPVGVLRALLELVGQRVKGSAQVANLYGSVVTEEGNATARSLMNKVFEECDTDWRGLGTIPGSGLALREEWSSRDASRVAVDLPDPVEPPGCRCGEVLKGIINPPECPLFDGPCTPDHPVGACMVSGEGSCSAWHRHERFRLEGRKTT